MTIEGLGRKVDNISDGLYDLVKQLNQQHDTTIFYFLVISIILATAMIITTCFIIKYLRNANKAIALNKKQIKELQNNILANTNKDLSPKEQEILQLLRSNPSKIDAIIYNLKNYY